jgi:prepilin-type processing-associated H-X9-DG protein
LPFFEQQALHDLGSNGTKIDTGQDARDQKAAAEQVVLQPIAMITCPSRRPSEGTFSFGFSEAQAGLNNSFTPDVAGRSDYAINAGHMYCEFPSPEGRGPATYQQAATWTANIGIGDPTWGNEKAQYIDGLTGVSYQRSTVNIRRVTDGTTNTYLIGEKHIHYDDCLTGRDRGDNETWCTGFNNDNFRTTGQLRGGVVVEAVPIPDNTRVPPEDDNIYRFGAPHPGGVNMSLCDGSVTTISFDIDWQVHRDLGNREDGNAVKVP